MLQSYVDAAPPGSRIDWATYYFRDRALAEALIRASQRGAHVRLVLEPDPRRKGANDAVVAMLKDKLGDGLHLYKPTPFNRGHLHAKIYAFSEPDIAWVGSFNPSGDVPEDPEVVAEIGDQDRGHNVLLGIERPVLTTALRQHVGILAGWRPLPLKLRPHFNRVVSDDGALVYFLPRLRPWPAEEEIARMTVSDRVRAAISHLKKGELTHQLRLAVRRGVDVQLLVHGTERRVPTHLVENLTASGVQITRVVHPDNLPMHAKFLLIERGKERSVWMGSHNFNPKSLTRNAEILLRVCDPMLFEALAGRFEAIAAMAIRTTRS